MHSPRKKKERLRPPELEAWSLRRSEASHDHATSSAGRRRLAVGNVPGAPVQYGGSLGRAGWSFGASLGRAGEGQNTCENRTRLSRWMFGAALPAPSRCPVRVLRHGNVVYRLFMAA